MARLSLIALPLPLCPTPTLYKQGNRFVSLSPSFSVLLLIVGCVDSGLSWTKELPRCFWTCRSMRRLSVARLGPRAPSLRLYSSDAASGRVAAYAFHCTNYFTGISLQSPPPLLPHTTPLASHRHHFPSQPPPLPISTPLPPISPPPLSHLTATAHTSLPPFQHSARMSGVKIVPVDFNLELMVLEALKKAYLDGDDMSDLSDWSDAGELDSYLEVRLTGLL